MKNNNVLCLYSRSVRHIVKRKLLFLMVALMPLSIWAEEPITSFSGHMRILYDGMIYLINLNNGTMMLEGQAPKKVEARNVVRRNAARRKNVSYGPLEFQDWYIEEMKLLELEKTYKELIGEETSEESGRRSLLPHISGLSGMFARARPRTSSYPYKTTEATTQASEEDDAILEKDKIYHLRLVLIGNEAFADNEDLTEVVLPNSVTTIWPKAFKGCKNLKKVTLPEGLLSIWWEAFSDCPSLESITIPQSMRDLEFSVFRNCTGLKTIDIQADSIPSGMFIDCTSLENVNIGGNVSQIGQFTFDGCTNLKEVNIPSSVKSIGWSAFENSGVTEVTIADGSALKTIAGCAFFKCTRLKNINLPEGLTDIGLQAFAYCEALTNISLPNSLTTMGEAAFALCPELEKVSVGDGLKRIERATFNGCTGLKEISFSDNSQLEYLGQWAFLDCTSLTSFFMPKGVNSLGKEPFDGCTNIESFRFSDALEEIGESMFCEWEKLKSFTFGKNPTVKNIAFNAFNGCTSLESFDIPEGVETIGDQAFASSGLKSITFPKSLTTISYMAFGWCDGLTEVTIPDNVTTMEAAFYYCKNLKTLNMGNGITEWDGDNINGCDALENIQWSDGIKKIEDKAFYRLTNLKTFTFGPNPSLEEIGEDAFSNSGIISFEMPASVKTLGEGVFNNCKSLESITLSPSLTVIPSFTLNGTAIKEITVPAGVISTGYASLGGKGSGETLTLTDVYILATTPPAELEDSWGKGHSPLFYDDAKNVTLHVPVGTKDAYAAATGWQKFKKIVEMIDMDVNGDGEVNVKDIVDIVNYMMGKPTSTGKFDEKAADANKDGTVNAADIEKIVNHIMGNK